MIMTIKKLAYILGFLTFDVTAHQATAQTIVADSAQSCGHFTASAEYIDITLVMQLENREISMRVPQEFLEDAWNRQDNVRMTAFAFRTMIDTFEPVKRSETPHLNFEYTSFLINDYVNLEALAELKLDSASPGRASPREPLADYSMQSFQYGLEEVIPNYPDELQENVYLLRDSNGEIDTVIACSIIGVANYPGCKQYSRTPSGVDLKFSYRLKYLPIWQEMQNNIHSFVECAIDEASQERL
ncbi:MAG: hypothetical protein L3J37_11575 [Rhodobacteraceae bacterium]|nr:hypothetical protein [Paracoccaceae bacterium]